MKTSHHIQIRQSRRFTAALIGLSIVAASLILMSGVTLPFALISLLLLVFLTGISIRYDGFARHKRIAAIYWSEDQKSGDSWVLELENGEQLPVALSESQSTLGGSLLTLVFLRRKPGRWRRPQILTALLLPDSADKEQLRLLRVALNFLS